MICNALSKCPECEMQCRKYMQWAAGRCTVGQIAPIYPDLPRADPSQIPPGGEPGCVTCVCTLPPLRGRSSSSTLPTSRGKVIIFDVTTVQGAFNCGPSSHPDFIKNYFLLKRMFRFFWHSRQMPYFIASRQKVTHLNFLGQKVTY